jgi:hypothetical protein
LFASAAKQESAGSMNSAIENVGEARHAALSKLTRKSSDSSVEVEEKEKEDAVVRLEGKRGCRGEDCAGNPPQPKPVGVSIEVQTEVSFTPLAQARVDALEFASEVMRLRVVEAEHRRKEAEQRAAELERACGAKDVRIAELEKLLAALR